MKTTLKRRTVVKNFQFDEVLRLAAANSLKRGFEIKWGISWSEEQSLLGRLRDQKDYSDSRVFSSVECERRTEGAALRWFAQIPILYFSRVGKTAKSDVPTAAQSARLREKIRKFAEENFDSGCVLPASSHKTWVESIKLSSRRKILLAHATWMNHCSEPIDWSVIPAAEEHTDKNSDCRIRDVSLAVLSYFDWGTVRLTNVRIPRNSGSP